MFEYTASNCWRLTSNELGVMRNKAAFSNSTFYASTFSKALTKQRETLAKLVGFPSRDSKSVSLSKSQKMYGLKLHRCYIIENLR
jgi:hypothetical protein